MKQILDDNTVEKIKAYYLDGEGKILLNSKEDNIRKRIHSAYLFMIDSSVATEKNIVKKLINTFKISERQAYLDIRNAQFIFGNVKKAEKEILRHIVTQWAIELYQTAKIDKDHNTMGKALDRIIRANHLDTDDPDMPDPSLIQPPVQLLSVDINIINSYRFKKMDKSAQDHILEVAEKIKIMANKLGIGEYLDYLDQPTLTPFQEVKDQDNELNDTL